MNSIRPHHIVSVLAAGGIAFAAFNFQNQPLRPIEEFVIFGSEKVRLAEDVQSLRGNIGSNEEIKIGERTQTSGDLFSDKIQLAENATIDGNIFARALKIAENAKIFGTSSIDITFPIAQIPEIPPFSFGNQDIKIEVDTEATLSPGSFRDLEIGENSRIIFQLGTYNLRSFTVRNSAQLVLESAATFNIAEDIKFSENISLFSKNNQINPGQILFQTPTKKSINFGKNSNLVFRFIAPNAKIHIAEDSLIRGNVWAKEIFVGEQMTLRDTSWFSIPSKPEDFVSTGGARFAVNVLEVNFVDAAIQEDAEYIAQLLNGRIVGFDPVTNLYAIEIPTRTIPELQAAIQKIRDLNDPKIEGVFEAVELPLISVP